MIKKRNLVIIFIIILCIVIFLVLLSDKMTKKPSEKENLKEELIEMAKNIEEEHKISIIASSGEKHIIYNLKTLKEVYGKNIDKFSKCDLYDTYVIIYPERKTKDKYVVQLNCD